MNLTNLFPVFISIAICLVVIFSELIKKLDRKDKLKGYKVYIPFVLSFILTGLLLLGEFFVTKQFWFWWASVFGFSVFLYEALIKKITSMLN